MKKQKILSTALVMFILSSCSSTSTSFYQVYKAEPISESITKVNFFNYEDENCIVSYDFWDNGGNMGFKFYNKSNKNIYLNLAECFYVINGNSYDYYKNRVYTNSITSGTTLSSNTTASKSMTGINYLDLIQTNRISVTNSTGLISTSGNSIAYVENKIICIPSKTSKYISEYRINESIYRDCDLLLYPTKKQIKTKYFTKDNSPIIFSNRIAYYIEDNEKLIKLENKFYISEITNYSENEIIEYKYNEYCEQKSYYKSKYIKNVSADKFYINYNYIKGYDIWEH